MNDGAARASRPEIQFFGCAGDYAELSTEMNDAVARVLASGQVLGGESVAEFEAQVAVACGRQHAVAVGSGTDALYFALLAAGVRPGDEVLVPAISFIASASAIVRLGARPVFVDVGADVMIDLDQAGQLITPATRALVFVHLFGGMFSPDRLEDFAQQHGLLLVEDFAQSFGASYAGRKAGSLGIAGATSFDPTKVLGAPGSGGALVTDDADIARRVRQLRLHGKAGSSFVESGYNSQLPSLAAAVLLQKLNRHAQWTRRRAVIAARYRAAVDRLGLTVPHVDSQVFHVWHKFVLLCDDRDRLAEGLQNRDVPVRVHYARPMCDEDLFADAWSEGGHPDVPAARAYCRRTLSLPIHSHMTAAEVDHVITSLEASLA